MLQADAIFPNGKRWEDVLREIEMLEVDTEHPRNDDNTLRIEGDAETVASAIRRARRQFGESFEVRGVRALRDIDGV